MHYYFIKVKNGVHLLFLKPNIINRMNLGKVKINIPVIVIRILKNIITHSGVV